MISRALGPALGGSIGLMFTVANTISVATYTIGFSESLLDFLQVYIILSYSNKFLNSNKYKLGATWFLLSYLGHCT